MVVGNTISLRHAGLHWHADTIRILMLFFKRFFFSSGYIWLVTMQRLVQPNVVLKN